MSAIGAASLTVSPPITGIHAGIVLKVDVPSSGLFPSVPILERILAVPDDIVSVTDVDLGIVP